MKDGDYERVSIISNARQYGSCLYMNPRHGSVNYLDTLKNKTQSFLS